MNRSHYENEMGRLAERWKGAYVPSLMALIWREVGTIEEQSFTRLVDELLGSARQAPLVPEFRDAAAKIRESRWQSEKAIHRREAREFMQQFSGEDFQMLCQAIRDRVNGVMDDDKFASFTTMLDRMPKAVVCRQCHGQGVLIHETYAYRCSCPAGRDRRENYPVFQGAEVMG